MTVGISTSVKNSALAGIRSLIDAGSGPGKIRLYNAPRPGTGVAITTQTLLSELDLVDTAPGSFADPSGGSMTLRLPVQDPSANATGTAVWARLVDSDGNFVMDIDVGDLLSAAELKLPTTAITLGGVVNIVSGTISVA
jgi:hypothetical protein